MSDAKADRLFAAIRARDAEIADLNRRLDALARDAASLEDDRECNAELVVKRDAEIAKLREDYKAAADGRAAFMEERNEARAEIERLKPVHSTWIGAVEELIARLDAALAAQRKAEGLLREVVDGGHMHDSWDQNGGGYPCSDDCEACERERRIRAALAAGKEPSAE